MKLEDEINQHVFRSEHHKLFLNLIVTHHWLVSQTSSVFEDEDITPPQYNVLRILRGAKVPLSIHTIRSRMLDKMSDTSRMVDRLVSKGLIEKRASTCDRRQAEVVICAAGKALLKRMDHKVDSLDRLLEPIPEKEAKKINHYLDALRKEVPDADHDL